MKKTILLFFLMLSLFIVGCVEQPVKKENDTIQGKASVVSDQELQEDLQDLEDLENLEKELEEIDFTELENLNLE